MKSKSSVIRFFYASSEQSADLFYLSGVFVPDPYLSILVGGQSYAVVNQLEYSRVRSQSQYDEVFLLESIRAKIGQQLDISAKSVAPAQLMAYFAALHNTKQVEVPANFPAVYYAQLLAAGFELQIACEPFFPQRAFKDDAQAAAIRQGNRASAAGIRAAEQVLKASDAVGNRLVYQGRTLTSERLRMLVDQACLQLGALAQNTIVAGGRQACDPHEGGHGPLRPNELIIVDVFPRIQKTGYHGDMTRTFLKGKANDAQRRLVAAVREAQLAAISKVQDGIDAAAVHGSVEAVFKQRNYQTRRSGEGFVGFIHSTGHGLGLEVHEAPSVSSRVGALRTGHVVTIEPGLYYPEIGACRIEDVVRVTADGYEMLSKCHYRWQLK